VIFLDVSSAIAASRLSASPDRLEAAGPAFHERVANGFRALAEAEPDRFRVIDGEGAVDDVAARVWETVVAALGPE
jgi:dTMP kinase